MTGQIALFTSADKSIIRNGVVSKYRPDFLYDCDKFVVIVEVDEGQHNTVSYNANCELVRMDGLAQACAVPMVIIRFNPDAFKISGMTERMGKPQRFDLLLQVLKQYLANGSSDFLTVCYIFFDQPNRLMHGETQQYVTTQRFQSHVDYESYAGTLYPSGCAAVASGTKWYTKT